MKKRATNRNKEGKLKKPRLKVVTKIDNNNPYPNKSAVISSVYHKFLPFFGLALVSLIYFLRLFYPQQSIFMIPDFGQSDVLHLNLPLKEILRSSLLQNRWPLWSDSLAAGFPVLAEGQIGTFYLPNLILFKYLPLIPAYNLNLWISFFLSSAGLYLICRKLKFTVFVSFITSLIFSYGGFFAVHLNHFNLIQAASLLPLILYSYLRLTHKPSIINLIFFSFLLSQQVFTGHFYISFITFISLLIICLSFKKKLLPKFSVLFLGSLIAVLFSAIQILPTFELFQLSDRKSGLSFEEVTTFPYPASHLITFFNPYFFGTPETGSYPPFTSDWGIFWENTAYLGLLPLFLAPFTLFLPRKNHVLTFILLLAASLLLVLGKNSPVYLIFSLPPFNFFRVPSKFLLLTSFSLTILSGFTLNQITKKITNHFLLITFYLSLITIFFLDEFSFSYRYPPLTPASWWLSPPEIINLIDKNAGRIKTYGSEIAWNYIFLNSGWQIPSNYLPLKNSLYQNSNVLYGRPQISINTGGVIPRRTKILRLLTDNLQDDQSLNLLKLWSVKYIITVSPIENTAWQKLGKTPDEFNRPLFYLYQADSIYPLVYLTTKTVLVDTLDEFKRQLVSLDTLNLTVLIEDKNNQIPPSSEENQPLISVRNADLYRKEFQITSRHERLLVVNQSNYPGWTFYLDGQRIPTLNVNLNQPAIRIPPGSHQVKMEFISASFTKGKTITILAMITAFLAVSLAPFLSSNKRQNTRQPSFHP
ncbi:hypothetical protein A3I51_03225 [Candidatus Gottesmanbacteria bacterium RIFCSPLOWO2_02_FULL_38_8]|uniref:Membrane protein 6-pyruvoyl-tetrahydropterin synthase-related domain-containing protein n=1 Tax=Candidatus Gottesmanbacteria bacterium RIFCSPLOWO2_02_FULL_38_8 TaxID=1798397 RepID=A0A1F6B3V6_9BACT|nr:MAG: hypothetical protein A3I51_03225 [Candidatus Gottesmanbacteria bacterium RIFCSPLOWO2_02_FULL_38_8]